MQKAGEQQAARSGDLLYVTDSGTDYSGAYVLVYSYPQGKHVGTITGFHRLTGECTDAKGDVFVVAPGEELSNPTTIYEFAHGGTKPIATLVESGEGGACAIDPTTGNLAVPNSADIDNPYQKDDGDVAIFLGAQGDPQMHYSSTLSEFATCGYDEGGNLYLAVAVSGGYQLASLDAGSGGSIEPLSLNTKLYGAFYFAPSLQWDGRHMTVSSPLKEGQFGQDSGPINVYRLSISGSSATVIGTTTLKANQERHRGQSWIKGKTIVGVNYNHGWPYVSFWPYPQGGDPMRQIRHKQRPPASVLWGVTISAPPKH